MTGWDTTLEPSKTQPKIRALLFYVNREENNEENLAGETER
jgi:hypothetical protein